MTNTQSLQMLSEDIKLACVQPVLYSLQANSIDSLPLITRRKKGEGKLLRLIIPLYNCASEVCQTLKLQLCLEPPHLRDTSIHCNFYSLYECNTAIYNIYSCDYIEIQAANLGIVTYTETSVQPMLSKQLNACKIMQPCTRNAAIIVVLQSYTFTHLDNGCR